MVTRFQMWDAGTSAELSQHCRGADSIPDTPHFAVENTQSTLEEVILVDAHGWITHLFGCRARLPSTLSLYMLRTFRSMFVGRVVDEHNSLLLITGVLSLPDMGDIEDR